MASMGKYPEKDELVSLVVPSSQTGQTLVKMCKSQKVG